MTPPTARTPVSPSRFYRAAAFAHGGSARTSHWLSGTVDARQVVADWMASPAHRRQLLTPRYREIGISAVRVEKAGGAFRGLDAAIVTADFGVRAR